MACTIVTIGLHRNQPRQLSFCGRSWIFYIRELATGIAANQELLLLCEIIAVHKCTNAAFDQFPPATQWSFNFGEGQLVSFGRTMRVLLPVRLQRSTTHPGTKATASASVTLLALVALHDRSLERLATRPDAGWPQLKSVSVRNYRLRELHRVPNPSCIQGRLRTSPVCSFACSLAIYSALAASALSGSRRNTSCSSTTPSCHRPSRHRARP